MERRCQCVNDFARETIRDYPDATYICVLIGSMTVCWHKKKDGVWRCTETNRPLRLV